jgi:hypothetical protein
MKTRLALISAANHENGFGSVDRKRPVNLPLLASLSA